MNKKIIFRLINETAGLKETFEHCCGVAEVSLASFDGSIEEVREYGLISEITAADLVRVFTESFKALDKAAFVFTDNNRKLKLHKLLSEIVEPIYLGVNPGSGNKLYMWVISKTAIAAYKKRIKTK